MVLLFCLANFSLFRPFDLSVKAAVDWRKLSFGSSTKVVKVCWNFYLLALDAHKFVAFLFRLELLDFSMNNVADLLINQKFTVWFTLKNPRGFCRRLGIVWNKNTLIRRVSLNNVSILIALCYLILVLDTFKESACNSRFTLVHHNDLVQIYGALNFLAVFFYLLGNFKVRLLLFHGVSVKLKLIFDEPSLLQNWWKSA